MRKIFLLYVLVLSLSACAPASAVVTQTSTPLPTLTPEPTFTPAPTATLTPLERFTDIQTYVAEKTSEVKTERGFGSFVEYRDSLEELKILGVSSQTDLPYSYNMMQGRVEEVVTVPSTHPHASELGIESDVMMLVTLPGAKTLYAVPAGVKMNDGRFVSMIPAYVGPDVADPADDEVLGEVDDFLKFEREYIVFRSVDVFFNWFGDVGVEAWDKLWSTGDFQNDSPTTYLNQSQRRSRESLEIFASWVSYANNYPTVVYEYKDDPDRAAVEASWEKMLVVLEKRPEFKVLLVDLIGDKDLPVNEEWGLSFIAGN